MKIYRAGRGWVCANKQRQMNQRWESENPERAEARRRKSGEHRLTKKADLRGECVVCGPVDIVPWGRGWTCGVRAAQLRKNQQEAPSTRCSCGQWLKAGQTRCSLCSLLDVPTPAPPAPLVEDEDNPGYSVVDLQTYERDARKVAKTDSVVKGWKMLGEPIDAGELDYWESVLAQEGL